MHALWRWGGDSLKLLLKPEFRSLWRLSRERRGNLHQIFNFTAMNRYPEVFGACQIYYPQDAEVRLLSFGCATGEEVLTLGQYFPHAQIVGIDINPWNIKTCQQHSVPEQRTFFHTDDPRWQEQNTYDAIFCMAVLQRTENRTLNPQDSSQIYPFSMFDQQLVELDRYLKQGGLMVLDETDYRFEDAMVASCYQPLAWDKPVLKERCLFDRNNQQISEGQTLHRIFVKGER